jgi:molybdopterin synthase catalytic subunit
MQKILAEMADESTGAMVFFVGTVRNHDDGERVLAIMYEVYDEMAQEILEKIESEMMARWSIKKFIAVQRTGYVKVGEISVVVAATSPHRQEAFDACRYGIDTIKTSIPVWKNEKVESGERWVKGVLLNVE